jgi:hypothetical protein
MQTSFTCTPLILCAVIAHMEPDDGKDAEHNLPSPEATTPAPPLPQPPPPAQPATELGFSAAELKEMRASLDLEVVSLLNLC